MGRDFGILFLDLLSLERRQRRGCIIEDGGGLYLRSGQSGSSVGPRASSASAAWRMVWMMTSSRLPMAMSRPARIAAALGLVRSKRVRRVTSIPVVDVDLQRSL